MEEKALFSNLKVGKMSQLILSPVVVLLCWFIRVKMQFKIGRKDIHTSCTCTAVVTIKMRNFLFTCCEESQTHSFAALTRSLAILHNS